MGTVAMHLFIPQNNEGEKKGAVVFGSTLAIVTTQTTSLHSFDVCPVPVTSSSYLTNCKSNTVLYIVFCTDQSAADGIYLPILPGIILSELFKSWDAQQNSLLLFSAPNFGAIQPTGSPKDGAADFFFLGYFINLSNHNL